MRRPNRRTLVSVFILCLPTAVMIALGVYFLVCEIPQFTRRELVEQMRSAKRNRRGERITDFRPGALRDKTDNVPWGYTKKHIWYASSPTNAPFAYQVARRDVENARLANVLYCGGGFVLLLLAGMTAFGAWYFIGYARERDDFLAATAHDLTTPLVGMRGCIGRDDATVKCLNERMLRLVANIKDFLLLGGRRPRPKREPFDVLRAFREAYALFRDDYRDLFDGADVPVEVEGEVPLVLADETMTVQVLWNLLGNDLKYAAPYGSVKVRVSADGGFVRLAFIDEGQGMTPRQMRRAFDRYYRAQTVLESGKGGFGIGLCTAREFARAMGGELSVRANSPRGCVFSLTLAVAD